MKRHWQLFLRASLPLGLLALCWVTLRTVATYSSESAVFYGFPYPWYGPSLVSSGEFEAAYLALALDAVVYLAVCHGLIMLAQRFRITVGKVLSFALWAGALCSLGMYAVLPATNSRWRAWGVDDYFSANAQRSHSIWIGLGK